MVCYDVRDPKRYRKTHKLLKGYGEPVQFSIFRCRLDDRGAAELRFELARVLSEEDSLLILDLCPRCAGRVISCNHKAGWDQPAPTFALALGPQTKPDHPPADQAPARAKASTADIPPATDGDHDL
ncbi:MAG: CRISPR-associated endonuclease Cas2 [Myxococcales bacterium]|nr:CRISPR-associated endonuclease Cas2 [Myxococcales bacterium]